jgi:serine/threonine protein kinase
MNTVKLLEVIQHQNTKKVTLVLENMQTDLRQWLTRHKLSAKKTDGCLYGNLTMSTVKSIMWQICNGLKCCHQQRILHRDIKPANILLSSEHKVEPKEEVVAKEEDLLVIKLTDFGTSRIFSPLSHHLTPEIMTLWYRAPEVFLGSKQPYSAAVDMWSAGCIMAELIRGGPAFPGNTEVDLIMRVFQVLGTPNEQTWPGLTKLCTHFKAIFPQWKPQDLSAWCGEGVLDKHGIDLLSRMLSMNPDTRISAKDALKHSWFDSEKKSLTCLSILKA